ncbi:Txe/YoeB family addiction module toxin [Empedobacter sp. GD03797]|uniref:Txe/YoeB family addiction module toxin n=1 Tax=Empedobacter sp. GD03797 TaxID=2975382 RepID=UPI0024493083|nr:Txe/YoeB family addiction module toxin [Empedobacter sp. GD03797]MDH1882492.1 Txe/YoeB family addiction module toxin [Empedobacter sp. GD03797]
MYNIDFTNYALEDLGKLKKSEPKAFKKVAKLIEELRIHPEKGTGHPKPLGGNRVGEWSRKITDKHRLIYTIDNDQVIVLVISAYGHYDDK